MEAYTALRKCVRKLIKKYPLVFHMIDFFYTFSHYSKRETRIPTGGCRVYCFRTKGEQNRGFPFMEFKAFTGMGVTLTCKGSGRKPHLNA